MKSLSSSNRFLFLICALFVLVGCASSDDTASPVAEEEVPPVEVDEVEESPPVTPLIEESTIEVDERTEEEAAIDSLDLTMLQLGVTDLEGTSNCVIDRLDSEGIELTGEGTAELIALIGCDQSVISEWLPDTNPALPVETWACTVESIGAWISDLSIPEAEAFFAAAQPPAEFIELTASSCDVSADEIVAALS